MTFTELFAASFGLIGTLLLATRSRHSGQRERDIAAGAKAWREAGEMDARGR